MILIHYTPTGAKRVLDMTDMFRGRTAMLVGGAPSLLEQPIELLNERGVLAMAMNNAAMHFRPTLWCSADHPDCYDPQILLDPTITKFAPYSHADTPVGAQKYRDLANTMFYIQKPAIPWDEFLANFTAVPWYNNTLFVSIHILYRMGIRRIILAGSDFGFSAKGAMYAHATDLGDLERKWNLDLYNSLVKELRLMQPIFDRYGLTLMDSSKNSRLSQVYQHITLEEAVSLCRESFPESPADPKDLPHCSKFAPRHIKEAIAEWPGHQQAILQENDSTPTPKKEVERRTEDTELRPIL